MEKFAHCQLISNVLPTLISRTKKSYYSDLNATTCDLHYTVWESDPPSVRCCTSEKRADRFSVWSAGKRKSPSRAEVPTMRFCLCVSLSVGLTVVVKGVEVTCSCYYWTHAIIKSAPHHTHVFLRVWMCASCTVAHKSHDPCFHKKYMEAGVMTFAAHCTATPITGNVNIYYSPNIRVLAPRVIAASCLQCLT